MLFCGLCINRILLIVLFLSSLSADQYVDIMKVCASMPLIDFKVHVEGKQK